MLNINFINTSKIDFDEDIYKSAKDLDKWVSIIKKLTKNVYTFQMSDLKIKQILQDDGNSWKVYVFVKAIENNEVGQGILTQSIVIYRLMASEKSYQIYNLYQIGAVQPKSDSDKDIDKFIDNLKSTILKSMTEITKSSKKRMIFYENIRESNVLYQVYDDMESDSEKDNLIVKMIENGNYRDGENKVLILMRFKGEQKMKVFDELETPSDFSKLIKTPAIRTPYTTKVTKPIFENADYKIYDSIPYGSLSEITKLHNDNMIKQREDSYFRKIIDKNKSVFLVARNNEGEVVGYILTRPQYSPLVTKGLFNTMNFVGIVVSPKIRGQGLGRKLIQLMEKRVVQMNQFEYIYGHVRFSNKSAKRLYQKMGYSLFPIGRYKDTNEIKYRLFKRLKRPNISRTVKEYRKEILIGFSLMLGHEIIHLLRKY